MVRAILVSVALSACVVGSAWGQVRPVGPSMGVGEAASDIQALKAEVAALQQQMVQLKASYDNQLTDARFRIAALEANQKQGGSPAQLESQINALTGRTSTLEAHWNATSPAIQGLELRLNTLSQNFQVHTHKYKITEFGVVDGKVTPPFNIGRNSKEELPTSTPQF